MLVMEAEEVKMRDKEEIKEAAPESLEGKSEGDLKGRLAAMKDELNNLKRQNSNNLREKKNAKLLNQPHLKFFWSK